MLWPRLSNGEPRVPRRVGGRRDLAPFRAPGRNEPHPASRRGGGEFSPTVGERWSRAPRSGSSRENGRPGLLGRQELRFACDSSCSSALPSAPRGRRVEPSFAGPRPLDSLPPRSCVTLPTRSARSGITSADAARVHEDLAHGIACPPRPSLDRRRLHVEAGAGPEAGEGAEEHVVGPLFAAGVQRPRRGESWPDRAGSVDLLEITWKMPSWMKACGAACRPCPSRRYVGPLRAVHHAPEEGARSSGFSLGLGPWATPMPIPRITEITAKAIARSGGDPHAIGLNPVEPVPCPLRLKCSLRGQLVCAARQRPHGRAPPTREGRASHSREPRRIANCLGSTPQRQAD